MTTTVFKQKAAIITTLCVQETLLTATATSPTCTSGSPPPPPPTPPSPRPTPRPSAPPLQLLPTPLLHLCPHHQLALKTSWTARWTTWTARWTRRDPTTTSTTTPSPAPTPRPPSSPRPSCTWPPPPTSPPPTSSSSSGSSRRLRCPTPAASCTSFKSPKSLVHFLFCRTLSTVLRNLNLRHLFSRSPWTWQGTTSPSQRPTSSASVSFRLTQQ